MKVMNVKFIVPDEIDKQDLALLLNQSKYKLQSYSGSFYSGYKFVDDKNDKYATIILEYGKLKSE